MQTVLFHESVFGPIHSRRLGTSLGINLMPNDGKLCSFDCIYCEAGYNAQGAGKDGIASRDAVRRALRRKLQTMRDEAQPLDSITFSGNGEPTLHPEFLEIVKDTCRARDDFYPQAKVTVLSNATMCGKEKVRKALKLVDNNVLKLDSAIDATMRTINCPTSPNFVVAGVVDDIKFFEGNCIVQTLLLRGSHNGVAVDNTTEAEIAALIAAYHEIKPRAIQLYTIDRKTPEENLERISAEELTAIGNRLRAEGFEVLINA